MGDAKFNLGNSIAYFVCISTGVFIGHYYGVTGVALGVVSGFICCFVLVTYRISKLLKTTITQLLGIILLPVVLSLLMWAGIMIMDTYSHQLIPLLNLVVLVVIGFISYSLLIAAFGQSYLRTLIKAFRKA